MIPNMLIVLLAALIPMVVGFLYYNPKLAGTVWMKESGMTEERVQSGNMLKMLLLSFICAFLFSFFLFGFVVHQTDVYSLYASEPGFMEENSAVMNRLDTLMKEFGDRFRTFGHGSFHGVLIALLFVVPILGTVSIFERKSFKYVAINGGYWVITLALMGGILCQWG
ncbi:MAG: DUF1761 domain-containing protein [Crocinitomicaceae bacterium]